MRGRGGLRWARSDAVGVTDGGGEIGMRGQPPSCERCVLVRRGGLGLRYTSKVCESQITARPARRARRGVGRTFKREGGCVMGAQIPGNLHVANDVLADMVGNAALECYGVVGMTAPTAADGIAKILPASRLRRGVVVTTTEVGVHVELYVVIEYGTNINTVSQNLIDQVSFVLKEYARVPLDGVEVHVQGVKVRR